MVCDIWSRWLYVVFPPIVLEFNTQRFDDTTDLRLRVCIFGSKCYYIIITIVFNQNVTYFCVIKFRFGRSKLEDGTDRVPESKVFNISRPTYDVTTSIKSMSSKRVKIQNASCHGTSLTKYHYWTLIHTISTASSFTQNDKSVSSGPPTTAS
jgi:hypothetical protein